MFQKSGAMYKVEEFVEIKLVGQPAFEAVVFLSVGDRLIDLLNDNRSFIPVKRMDNSTIIMSKSNIVSILEKDPFAVEDDEDSATSQDITPHFEEDEFEDKPFGESDADQDGDSKDPNKEEEQKKKRRRRKKAQQFDAYAVLKVSPDASLDEIRKVYKSRIKTVHPDTVAALDLGEDLVKAAIQTTQRINFAYHQILKERRAEAKAPKKDNEASSKDEDGANANADDQDEPTSGEGQAA